MSANPFLTSHERQILENATVGIAGAGGLGSNCAAHLVRAGIRRLVIADFDVVSEGNLNRQFFFRDQVGLKKVDALRENLLRIDCDLTLEMHDIKLNDANIGPMFAACGIVAEALDSAQDKAMLVDTLLPAGKTVVTVSGIAGWGRSNDIIARQVGGNLVMIGDCHTAVDPSMCVWPVSPRVGIAAAMQANSIVARLLKKDI